MCVFACVCVTMYNWKCQLYETQTCNFKCFVSYICVLCSTLPSNLQNVPALVKSRNKTFTCSPHDTRTQKSKYEAGYRGVQPATVPVILNYKLCIMNYELWVGIKSIYFDFDSYSCSWCLFILTIFGKIELQFLFSSP